MNFGERGGKCSTTLCTALRANTPLAYADIYNLECGRPTQDPGEILMNH